VSELAERRAERFHPDRVDHRVRAASVGEALERLDDVVLLSRVDRVHAVTARHFQALVDGSTPKTSPAPRRSAIRHDI
jgi:hypothetical protein